MLGSQAARFAQYGLCADAVSRPLGPKRKSSLALLANDEFAKVVAGQKELHRTGAFKQFLKQAVVEVLALLVTAAGSLEQCLGILNPIVVNRNAVRLFI